MVVFGFSPKRGGYNNGLSILVIYVFRVYATIRETSADRRSTICGSMGRVVNVFTSLGDKLELRVLSVPKPYKPAVSPNAGVTPPLQQAQEVHFLFHYSGARSYFRLSNIRTTFLCYE